MTAAFLALLVLAISLFAVSWRNDQTQRRGIRDAAQFMPLPYHVPKAGMNIDLSVVSSRDHPAILDKLHALGIYWLRQPVRWSQVEVTRGEYIWTAVKQAVDSIRFDGRFGLILVLDESPAWARVPAGEGSRYAPPASAAAFATFAGAAAAQFKGGVDYYQVWDEPNLRAHWGGLDPRPADYVALLRSAYTAIHAADPAAQVMSAGLAPTVEEGPANLSDVLYLQTMYADGARDVMDAVAGKPYGFDASPLDRTMRNGTLTFSRLILLREVMEQNGDGAKLLFGTQFGWNSLPDGWQGPPSIWGQVNADTQELYTRLAFERAAREWPWAGGLILEAWAPGAEADDPIQGFAIVAKADQWISHGPLNPIQDPALRMIADGLYRPTDKAIQYTGNWRLGPLGADIGVNDDGSLSAFTTTFQGTSVSLQVRRADYVAYLYVSVDGQAANRLPQDASGKSFILLTSPNRTSQTDLIQVAEGLDPDQPHKLEVRAYLGAGQWAITGIAASRAIPNPQTPLLAGAGLLALIATIGLVWSARQLPWSALHTPAQTIAAYGRRMADVIAGVGVTAAAGLGMALTVGGTVPNLFRRDEPAVLLTIVTAGLAYFSPGLLLSAASIIVLFIIIYNRPALGLCLVAFFAPFFLYPVQNYIRALPMVELVLLLTAAAVVLRGVVRRMARAPTPLAGVPAIRWVDYGWVVFGGLALLSILWSEQRAPALRELRIIVIEPIVFYGLIRFTRLDRRDVLRLVDSLIAAGALVCILGLIGYVTGLAGVVAAEGGVQRLGSIYGSPNNLALFIGRCIPLTLAMGLFPLSRTRRVAAALVLILMVGTVILTQSAGGLLLGIPAACAVVLIAWDRRKGLAITAAGIALVLIGGVIFLPRVSATLGGNRESSLTRVNVWMSAITLIRERPITGAGLDQFLYLYRSRYILPDAYKEPDLSHPHNLVLDFWVRLGIGGVALLIALQIGFWRAIMGARRQLLRNKGRINDILGLALCAGLMGTMADFLAHGLVDNSYFVIDLAYVFALSVALAVILNAQAATVAGAAGTSLSSSSPDSSPGPMIS